MKITWHRQAITQLQLPPICAATGQPTQTRMTMLYRNKLATYLPRFGWIFSLANRPVAMQTPVTPEVRQGVTRWRWISLGGLLGGVVAAVLLALLAGALSDGSGLGVVGGLLALVLIGAGYAVYVVGAVKADVLNTDVRGDWISVSAAHPAYAEALVRMNPPGMVRVEGMPLPQGGYPQQVPQQFAPQQVAPPQAVRQPYPPQAYPAPSYPQQPSGYPQQQGYPQQGYPRPQPYPATQQPQQEQSYDPVMGYRSAADSPVNPK